MKSILSCLVTSTWWSVKPIPLLLKVHVFCDHKKSQDLDVSEHRLPGYPIKICWSIIMFPWWLQCGWPPFDSVQLVNITPMSLWFMVLICTYNYSYWGESKPTYNWGASHCSWWYTPFSNPHRTFLLAWLSAIAFGVAHSAVGHGLDPHSIDHSYLT